MLTELELLDRAVIDLAGAGGSSLAFGGLTTTRGVYISTIHGHLTGALTGLQVERQRGLGGRAIFERRPRITPDYRSSTGITHDYDRQVLSEQVRSLVAVPVLVDDQVRAVVYAATRSRDSLGAVALDPIVAIADGLGRSFALRDAAHAQARTGATVPSVDSRAQEELREVFAQVRAIAARTTDPEARRRLRELEQRLAAGDRAGAEADAGAGQAGAGVETGTASGMQHGGEGRGLSLAPRELDVLGFVALGMRNAEVARELGIGESTVKSYLGTAMQKLGASNRHAAVTEARRRRLLP